MTDAPWPYSLRPPRGSSSWLDRPLAASCRRVAGEATAALGLAPRLGACAAALGTDSGAYLRALATLGASDLSVARALEPHLDALAILAQARAEGTLDEAALSALGVTERSTWGVYAAQAPGLRLAAETGAGGVVLTGTKPWCSLAAEVSHALITAEAPEAAGGPQRLYAIALDHPGVAVDAAAWAPRGLTSVTTATLRLAGVPAVGIGAPGWYLSRPGFAWGGIGVAAVWFGAACALASGLTRAARRREPDQVALRHIGRTDLALSAAAAALVDAAERMDAPGAGAEPHPATLAARVRGLCAEAAEQTLTLVGHALGPGPLAHDPEHVARVADLTLYVRQHHAERDLARLGGLVLREEGAAPG